MIFPDDSKSLLKKEIQNRQNISCRNWFSKLDTWHFGGRWKYQESRHQNRWNPDPHNRDLLSNFSSTSEKSSVQLWKSISIRKNLSILDFFFFKWLRIIREDHFWALESPETRSGSRFWKVVLYLLFFHRLEDFRNAFQKAAHMPRVYGERFWRVSFFSPNLDFPKIMRRTVFGRIGTPGVPDHLVLAPWETSLRHGWFQELVGATLRPSLRHGWFQELVWGPPSVARCRWRRQKHCGTPRSV